MNLIPAAGKYVLRLDPEQEMTAGGIVLPDTADKQGNYATVVAVNAASFRDKNGHLTNPISKTGDRVLIGRYAGVRIEHDGEELVVINHDEILAYLR